MARGKDKSHFHQAGRPDAAGEESASDSGGGDAFWQLDRLAEVIGGAWRVEPDDRAFVARGVSIDSRSIEPGEVFFAIVGEHADGHRYIEHAMRQGAALVVAQSDRMSGDATYSGQALWPDGFTFQPGVLVVDDGVAALQRLAGAYRDRLQARGVTVIAVGGSNGKTTTRRLIHSGLSAAMAGSQSPKSFNNHLGVPLTLLATRCEANHDHPVDRFVVCEIGTNHPGEVAALRRLARPDVAVLTSLGREHLEHFGSVEAVAKEEAALLAELGPTGTAVVETNAARMLEQQALLPQETTITRYGLTKEPVSSTQQDSNERAVAADPAANRANRDNSAHGSASREINFTITAGPWPTARGQRFVVNDQWSLALPLLGRHNAMNALAALAVAEALDVSIETVTEGLAEASPPAARMQLRRFSLPEGPCFVIDDSYNANPDSMRPALCVLLDELANSTDPAEESAGQTPAGGRAVAVLGEMRELGATSEREHRALGHWLAARSYQPAAVMTVGQQARPIGEALTASGGRSEVEAFDGLDSATIETIASRVKPHDVVLIKGSRGVGLERVIAAIEARAAGER